MSAVSAVVTVAMSAAISIVTPGRLARCLSHGLVLFQGEKSIVVVAVPASAPASTLASAAAFHIPIPVSTAVSVISVPVAALASAASAASTATTATRDRVETVQEAAALNGVIDHTNAPVSFGVGWRGGGFETFDDVAGSRG